MPVGSIRVNPPTANTEEQLTPFLSGDKIQLASHILDHGFALYLE
jgi:hypothetical protein